MEADLTGYPDHPYLKQGFQVIQNSSEIFFGFQIKNYQVGVISFEKEDPASLTICRLIVKPSHFKKGLTGKLIKAVEECEPGIRYIYVETGKENPPAIRRYQKSGYSLIDEFKTPDGLAIVRFQKKI